MNPESTPTPTPTPRPTPPRITVAVPTYRGVDTLEPTLRSILDQEIPEPLPFALLVRDDQSGDGTPELAARLVGHRGRVVVNDENLGLAGNWNRCLETAETEWVAVFHQDDLMRPGHLDGLLRTIDAHPDAAMICGAFRVVDARGEPIPERVIERPRLAETDRLYPPGAFLRELAERNPVRCSTVALRRTALLDLGGFDPRRRHPYALDWEAWARLARRHPVVWRAEPTVDVRWHAASETHRFHRGLDDLDDVAAVLDDIRSDPLWSHLERLELRRRNRAFLARAHLNRAHSAAKAAPPASRLVRDALAAAWRLDRNAVLRTLARDPRLVLRILASQLAPSKRKPAAAPG